MQYLVLYQWQDSIPAITFECIDLYTRRPGYSVRLEAGVRLTITRLTAVRLSGKITEVLVTGIRTYISLTEPTTV